MTAVTTPVADPVRATGSGPARPAGGRLWPVAGIGAGVSGLVATALGSAWIDDPSVHGGGPEAVVATLPDALPTQLGAAVGHLGVALLVVFSVGLVRLVADRAPDRRDLAGVLAVFLGVAAATTTGGFLMKSVLAAGMPGGMDVDHYTTVDTAVSHMLANQLQFGGFLPLTGAAATLAVLALRHGALQRWVGVVSLGVAVAITTVTAVLNLPWSAGLLGPVWLVLVGVAVLRRPGVG